MNLSLKNEWKVNALFLTKSRAEATAYMQKISQQKMQSPPASSIPVPETLALSSSPKAIMLGGGGGAWAVKGSAQVTVVSGKMPTRLRLWGNLPHNTWQGLRPMHPTRQGGKKKKARYKEQEIRSENVRENVARTCGEGRCRRDLSDRSCDRTNRRNAFPTDRRGQDYAG